MAAAVTNHEANKIVDVEVGTADDDLCGECVNITTEIRDVVLTQANEQAAIAALEAVCKKLGPVEGMCDEAVKSYVPRYFEMARNFLNNPKMLCKFAGLCQQTNSAAITDSAKFPSLENAPSDYQVSTEGCSLCSNVAQGLKSLLRLPGFAESLPSAACSIVDEDDQECLELMRGFVEVFHEHMDPAIICASSFCSNSGVDFILEEAEERLHLQGEEDEEENFMSMNTDAPTTAPPPPPPKPLPKVCRRCIHHTKRSLRFMEKKLWRDRRRWLWGCKFALNKTKCIDAVKDFINKAEQRLKHTCPMKVCAKLGFCPPKNCTSSSLPHDHVDVEVLNSVPTMKLVPAIETVPLVKVEATAHRVDLKDNVCTYCEEVVNYVKILIGNPSAKEEVKEFLLAQCKNTGLMQSLCEKFVKEDLVGLLDRVAHLDTKQTCVALHLCSASGSFQSLLSSIAVSSACSTCKDIVKQGVMPLISSSGSERDMSIGLCHSLGLNNLMCHNHLSNFLAVAKARFNIGGGSQDSAAAGVCQPFCRSGLAQDWDQCLDVKDESETEAKTTEAPTTEAPTTEAPTTEPPTTTPAPGPQPPACKQCIFALSMIKKDLTKKLSCFQRRFTKACGLLPPLKSECQAAIRAFFAPLMAKIAKVEPKRVCVQLGVCIPSEAEVEESAFLPPSLPLIPIVGGAGFNLGVKGGRSRQLADIFGGVGPVILSEDLANDIAPKAVDDGKIRVGGKSKGSSSSSTSSADSSISQDAVCTVCSYLVDELKEELKQGSTKEELKALIMAGCTKLPVKQRDECIQYMVPIVGKTVDFLEKVPTKEICQVAQACPAVGQSPPSSKMELGSMECWACKFGAEEVKDLWSNPNVPKTINSTLHSICLKLPVDYQPQCHGAIDQTFPVIDGMLKEMDPEQVCQAIGACEANKKHLLGADVDCLWNVSPKNSCKDWQTVVKCRRIDFCKKNVWGTE